MLSLLRTAARQWRALRASAATTLLPSALAGLVACSCSWVDIRRYSAVSVNTQGKL